MAWGHVEGILLGGSCWEPVLCVLTVRCPSNIHVVVPGEPWVHGLELGESVWPGDSSAQKATPAEASEGLSAGGKRRRQGGVARAAGAQNSERPWAHCRLRCKDLAGRPFRGHAACPLKPAWLLCLRLRCVMVRLACTWSAAGG